MCLFDTFISFYFHLSDTLTTAAHPNNCSMICADPLFAYSSGLVAPPFVHLHVTWDNCMLGQIPHILVGCLCCSVSYNNLCSVWSLVIPQTSLFLSVHCCWFVSIIAVSLASLLNICILIPCVWFLTNKIYFRLAASVIFIWLLNIYVCCYQTMHPLSLA